MFQFFSVCFFQVIFAGVILFRYFSGFICPYSLQFSGFLFFWFFSFFSGVTFFRCHFSWLLFRLHFLHDCFCQVWFFQVAWKTSNFMLRFHVVFLSFLLPSSRNEAAACASFADLDGDGNLEALTGCNCLFLVFGGIKDDKSIWGKPPTHDVHRFHPPIGDSTSNLNWGYVGIFGFCLQIFQWIFDSTPSNVECLFRSGLETILDTYIGGFLRRRLPWPDPPKFLKDVPLHTWHMHQSKLQCLWHETSKMYLPRRHGRSSMHPMCQILLSWFWRMQEMSRIWYWERHLLETRNMSRWWDERDEPDVRDVRDECHQQL